MAIPEAKKKQMLLDFAARLKNAQVLREKLATVKERLIGDVSGLFAQPQTAAGKIAIVELCHSNTRCFVLPS